MNTKRRRRHHVLLALALALVLALAPTTAAADKAPGLVVADAFVDLVGDEAVQVEINISPTLIRMMMSGVRDADPDLAELIDGLQGIRALILDVSESAAREQVEPLIRDTVRGMERNGWERMAVVRDESSVLHVLVRGDGDDRVRGLLVLILERDSNELVFVNLHGRIDLAKLQVISDELGLPGLDRVPVEDDR